MIALVTYAAQAVVIVLGLGFIEARFGHSAAMNAAMAALGFCIAGLVFA